MNKKWSCIVRIDPSVSAKFIIEQKDEYYYLSFYEQFGDSTHLHHSKDLTEIFSFLLTTHTVRTQNAVYKITSSMRLKIPPELSEWIVES